MFHNPVYAASPTDPPSLAGTVPGTRPAAKGVAAEQALKPLWRLSAGAADAESCTDNSTPTSLLRVRRQSTAMRVVLVALILATVGIVLGAAALAVAAADKSNSKRLAALEQEILVNNDAASALEQRLSASEAGLAGLKQSKVELANLASLELQLSQLQTDVSSLTAAVNAQHPVMSYIGHNVSMSADSIDFYSIAPGTYYVQIEFLRPTVTGCRIVMEFGRASGWVTGGHSASLLTYGSTPTLITSNEFLPLCDSISTNPYSVAFYQLYLNRISIANHMQLSGNGIWKAASNGAVTAGHLWGAFNTGLTAFRLRCDDWSSPIRGSVTLYRITDD